MRLLALSLLALVGCSQAAPPAPQPAPAASAPAAPPPASSTWAAVPPPTPCLPIVAEGAELLSTKIDGTTLTACFRPEGNDEARVNPCLSFDLTTKKPTAASEAPDLEPPPEKVGLVSILTTTETEIRVCAEGPKKCKVIRPASVAKGVARMGHGDSSIDALIAALSDDRKQVAVLIPERNPKGHTSANIPYHVAVETYEVASGKRLSRTVVPVGDEQHLGFFSDSSDNWGVQWLGSRLKLSAYRCCGPAGGQQILDPKKGTFEWLGDPALFEHIGGDAYLLGLEERSETDGFLSLTFLHLDSGKRTRIMLPARPRNEPETHVLASHRLGPDRVLIVHANPPGVAWLDLAKDSVAEHHPLPLCK